MLASELIEILKEKAHYDLGEVNLKIDDEKETIRITRKKRASKPKADLREVVKEKLRSPESTYSASEFREVFKYYYERLLGKEHISNRVADFKHMKTIFNVKQYNNDHVLLVRKYFKMSRVAFPQDNLSIVHMGWKMPLIIRALEVEKKEEELKEVKENEFVGEVF